MIGRALPDRFETRRLRLRGPRPDDADGIFTAYGHDAEVCRYMVWTPHERVETLRVFVDEVVRQWDAGDRFAYVLTLDDDAPIGMIDAMLRPTTVVLGYVLARAHWGRGLMREAIEVVTDSALASPRFFRVEAQCDVDNIASARVLEKSGFAREGRLERSTIHPNLSREPRACFLYARVRA